jgi:hypothetical protein
MPRRSLGVVASVIPSSCSTEIAVSAASMPRLCGMRCATRLLLMILAACRPHVEYLYAHTITGIVIDADGHAVPAIQVARLLPSGSEFGDDELYVTTSDSSGRFAFRYRGFGGQPTGSDRWLLRARDARGEGRATIVAPWRCDSGSANACPGYHANVVLRLR